MAMIEGHRAIAPPPGVAVWDVDPYDPKILAEPVPYYAELRRRGRWCSSRATPSSPAAAMR